MSTTETQGGALATTTSSSAVLAGIDDFLPSKQMMDFCGMIAQSNLVPKDFRGRPADVLIAVLMGTEVGLKPMQALHSIAVINGRPSLWGDGALAVVRARPDCEDVIETIEGENDKRVATCTVKRFGKTPTTRTFSMAQAKAANLFNKEGPWRQYPDRMLQMRARGFAMRDAFPDALKGFAIAEEAMDIPADEAMPVATGAAETPAAPTATRVSSVRDKIRAQVQTVTPTQSEAEQGDAKNEPADSAENADPPAGSDQEKEVARELRRQIGEVWKGVESDVKIDILKRHYAKAALTDLTIPQLRDFLEKSPALVAEILG